MRAPSDAVLDHLRSVADLPDLGGTRYRLIRPLARGGMGSLYVVEDRELGREVALKVVSIPDAPGDVDERLRREARILAGLEHPNIVPVHDAGRLPDGRAFYVMKLVRGQRLDEWARERGRSRAEVLRVFQKVCEAVAFANAHGVIHRDLKPDNVMVGPFGEALVMDWGIAKVRAEIAAAAPPRPLDGSAGVTNDGAILGTPSYMAPEQARGDNDRVDARTDVHALGGILYFLLAGRPPYTGRTALEVVQAVLERPPAPLRGKDGKLPRALESIVGKALAKDPAARYASAIDLAADVDRFLDGFAPVAHRETPVEKVARFVGKNKALLLILLAYLVARALVAALAGR